MHQVPDFHFTVTKCSDATPMHPFVNGYKETIIFKQTNDIDLPYSGCLSF